MLGSMGNTGGEQLMKIMEYECPPNLLCFVIYKYVSFLRGVIWLIDCHGFWDFSVKACLFFIGKEILWSFAGADAVGSRRYVKREECGDFVWGFSLISSILWVLHPLRLLWEWRKLSTCGMAGFTMQGHLPLHHSQSWLKNHKNKNKSWDTMAFWIYFCIECET